MLTTKMQDKLQSSELRYRRLFETAQDGILIIDAESGTIDDANPALGNIFGFSQNELLGKQLWQIGIFKNIIDSKTNFLELFSEKPVRYKDVSLKTKSDQTVDIELISTHYTINQQRIIQCNLREISDRKSAQRVASLRTRQLELLGQEQENTKIAMLNVMEDLEAAKALIEIEKVKDDAILASIDDGLIAVDSDHKIIVMNNSAERMLGWKKEELLNTKVTSLPLIDMTGRLLPLKKRPVDLAISTGRPVSGTYYFVKRDKTRLPIAITVTPIRIGEKIIGALDVFRDITKELEVDRSKSEFVSLASHQLRTPLGIIKWYLEALKEEVNFNELPPMAQRYFDAIQESNERVLSLVRNLLFVSRIEQGRVRNVLESVCPTKVIKDVVGQMQVLARKKNVALNLSINDKGIPLITIDTLRLHEVLENLIVNAIEYTKALGTVNVRIKAAGGALLIDVEDTGIGISPADQKKLFTKFFRSQKATSHNPEGSGLGLYVVKSYVEGWGGKVLVKSQENIGSRFTISLPVVQAKPL